MTKNDLINHISTTAGITKTQATSALDAFQAAAVSSVKKEGRFALPGFGTFTKRKRAASSGVVPGSTTGATWKKPAHNTVGFKPAPGFKDSLGKR